MFERHRVLWGCLGRSKFGGSTLPGKVALCFLLNFLARLKRASLCETLFALSFCAAVLSLHVGWERSQLKAKLCYPM